MPYQEMGISLLGTLVPWKPSTKGDMWPPTRIDLDRRSQSQNNRLIPRPLVHHKIHSGAFCDCLGPARLLTSTSDTFSPLLYPQSIDTLSLSFVYCLLFSSLKY